MVGPTLQEASCLEYEYLGSQMTGEQSLDFVVEGRLGFDDLASAISERAARATPPTAFASVTPTFGGAGYTALSVDDMLHLSGAATTRDANGRAAQAWEFEPTTPLGRKLMEIRRRAIENGMTFLTQEEVEAEVRARRGDYQGS